MYISRCAVGGLIQALIFLSSQSSESDKSYKKQSVEREGEM